MLHTSVKERQGWEHWVVGRFTSSNEEHIIASSGSVLYLYSVIESPLTGTRRLICLASQELYSTILGLDVLDLSKESGSRALLLAIDDGGRLSVHTVQCTADNRASVSFFHCILTHRVSRSGIRSTSPWRVASRLGYIAVLLLDATLLIFKLETKERLHGADSMLLETLGPDEMFLLPPTVISLGDALLTPGSTDKIEGPRPPRRWGVPQLLSLDLCIALLSEPCCIILGKDTSTGLHLLFRVAMVDTCSKVHHLIVHPSILAIRTISSGLIGFGGKLILCLSSDFLNTMWLDIYPFLHAHRDGTGAFDYAEEGELLISIASLSSYELPDPLRLVGCALFGTYLAIASEAPVSPSTGHIIFAQEVHLDQSSSCSHVWLCSEIGELTSILIPTDQSSFTLNNILFLSSAVSSNLSHISEANTQVERFTLHSTGSLSIQIIRVGTLSIPCQGCFLLTSGFLGCVMATGSLTLYRIVDLPRGHKLAPLPLLSRLVQYPTYRDGSPIYPALQLLRLLTQPVTLKEGFREEDTAEFLSRILLHETSLPIADIIASAVVLSAPNAVDSKYLVANKTSLSLCSLAVPMTHIYSGSLIKEESSAVSSVALYQVMFDSTGYLIFSCTTLNPQQTRRNICLKVVDTGLEYASHHSKIVYKPTILSSVRTEVLEVNLLFVSESLATQQNATPIYMEGHLLGIFTLHNGIILQIFEGDEPCRLKLVFISLCHSSIRRALSYASQIPPDHDEYTDDSTTDFLTSKWSSSGVGRHKYDDELSENEPGVSESSSYLLFTYDCSLKVPLVSVLYCMPINDRSAQICFQTQNGLLKLSVNTENLHRLQLCTGRDKESHPHNLHISQFLPTFMVDCHVSFNQYIKQSCHKLAHICSDLFLCSNNNVLALYSNFLFSENVNQAIDSVDSGFKYAASAFVLDEKRHIIYIFLNPHWSSPTDYRYAPVFVVATDGLHIFYVDKKEEKILDMKSIMSLLELNEYLETTASIFAKNAPILFSDQPHEMKSFKVHPVSTTSVMLASDGTVFYWLAFSVIKDCLIPRQLYRLDFPISSFLSIASLSIEGALDKYFIGVTADLQFHVFEPVEGLLCPSLASIKVFVEDNAGLSVHGLTMLKGGYCACIIRSHSVPNKTSLVVIRTMGLGRKLPDSELGIKYTLPLAACTSLLSYDYSSGRLSWADGQSFYTIDNIAKLLSRQIKEIHPAHYLLSSEWDITALCGMGQSSTTLCIGMAQRLLVYDTAIKEVVAQELLPDAIIRLVFLGNSRIVVAMNKAGLAVFSFSQAPKCKLALELTDSVPMRIITAILPLNPDIIVVGDRFGTISVLSCTIDSRYHQASVSKKLSLYAEICVASPVTSLTAEPRRGKGSTTIIYYTLFTGEIGKIELITDRSTFSCLLCDQETAHKNGLYNPTTSIASESHRRFRCGPYSFVNTVDISFLSDICRTHSLKQNFSKLTQKESP